MKKYVVTVTRTVEYEVEIDETTYNEEAQEDFERYFWPLPIGDIPAEGFAKALAEQSIRQGVNTFIEGFGEILPDREWAELKKARGEECNDKFFIREGEEYIESEIEETTEE